MVSHLSQLIQALLGDEGSWEARPSALGVPLLEPVRTKGIVSLGACASEASLGL